jgi:hypothetical protein
MFPDPDTSSVVDRVIDKEEVNTIEDLYQVSAGRLARSNWLENLEGTPGHLSEKRAPVRPTAKSSNLDSADQKRARRRQIRELKTSITIATVRTEACVPPSPTKFRMGPTMLIGLSLQTAIQEDPPRFPCRPCGEASRLGQMFPPTLKPPSNMVPEVNPSSSVARSK